MKAKTEHLLNNLTKKKNSQFNQILETDDIC